MSLALTIIGSRYEGGNADQVSRLRYTGSFTNPYTAGGEAITTFPFTKKFFGGKVLSVNPVVATNLAGALGNAVFRSDTTSTGTVILQLLQTGLSGAASAGLWVDNTTANISNATCVIEISGK